jgi:hypothetical protein
VKSTMVWDDERRLGDTEMYCGGLTSFRRLAAQFGAIPTIETHCDFATQGG